MTGPKDDELLFDWDLFEAETSLGDADESFEGSASKGEEFQTWDVDQWLGRSTYVK